MVFVNLTYDMIINTQFYTKYHIKTYLEVYKDCKPNFVGNITGHIRSIRICNVGLIWISRVHLGKILHNTSEVYYNMTTAV